MSDLTWIVELGLGSSGGGGLWDTAVWDTDVWAGGEPDWIPITEYVLELETNRGRLSLVDRIKTGSASVVVDNSSGVFNPDVGPTLPGNLTLRPGRWIRIRTQLLGGEVTPDPVSVPDGTTWTDTTTRTWTANGTSLVYQGDPVPGVQDDIVFIGVVDEIDERYGAGGDDSTTRILAYDFMSTFASAQDVETAPEGVGELTSARVERLLDKASWPPEWRNIPTGSFTMQGLTNGDRRARWLIEAARSEAGAFYFEGLTATFWDYQYLQTAPRSITVQAYPGRGLTDDPVVLDVDSDWSIQLVRNDIQLQRVGETVGVRETNTISQGAYGQRTYKYDQYYNDSDVDLQTIAQQALFRNQWDYQRLRAVDIYGTTTGQLSTIARLRLGDLVQVAVPLTIRGWGYTVQAHIVGVSWQATTDDFRCRLFVDQASRGVPGEARAFSDGFNTGFL